MSNVKISTPPNIDEQNIECKISSGEISDAKYRMVKYQKQNIERKYRKKSKYLKKVENIVRKFIERANYRK